MWSLRVGNDQRHRCSLLHCFVQTRGGAPIGTAGKLGGAICVTQRGLLFQLRQQQRLRVGGNRNAPDNAGPQIDGRSSDKSGVERHDLEIVVEVLPSAAVECAAGYTRVALAVVANTPDVSAALVGQEDVGAEIDR